MCCIVSAGEYTAQPTRQLTLSLAVTCVLCNTLLELACSGTSMEYRAVQKRRYGVDIPRYCIFNPNGKNVTAWLRDVVEAILDPVGIEQRIMGRLVRR